MAKRGKGYLELTDTACRNARPGDTVKYWPDRGRESVPGLRLCVRPNGAKLWLLRYYLPKTDERGNLLNDVSGKPMMRESTAWS